MCDMRCVVWCVLWCVLWCVIVWWYVWSDACVLDRVGQSCTAVQQCTALTLLWLYDTVQHSNITIKHYPALCSNVQHNTALFFHCTASKSISNIFLMPVKILFDGHQKDLDVRQNICCTVVWYYVGYDFWTAEHHCTTLTLLSMYNTVQHCNITVQHYPSLFSTVQHWPNCKVKIFLMAVKFFLTAVKFFFDGRQNLFWWPSKSFLSAIKIIFWWQSKTLLYSAVQ
jgi:hypothetical protein